VLAEDIEHAILTGKIIERQSDRATREQKYVLSGADCSGESVYVVLKVGSTRKAVTITVYREEE